MAIIATERTMTTSLQHTTHAARVWRMVLGASLASIALALTVALVGLQPRSAPEASALAARSDAAFARGMDSTGDAATRREAFREAADGFAQLRTYADRPETSFNLGNARFRAGDAAGAVAAYRRALLLSPRFSAATQNLSEALRALEKVPPQPAPTVIDRMRNVTAALPSSIRAFMALLLWAVGFALLLWRLRTRVHSALAPSEHTSQQPRDGGGASARTSYLLPLAAIALSLVFAATMMLDHLAMQWSDRAVVTTAAIARKGNGAGFEPAYAEPLPVGTECRVQETRPGWIMVEIGDGTTAWLPDSCLLRV
jgi:hypothetical protein